MEKSKMMRMEIEGQMHGWTDNVKREHPTTKTVFFFVVE